MLLHWYCYCTSWTPLWSVWIFDSLMIADPPSSANLWLPQLHDTLNGRGVWEDCWSEVSEWQTLFSVVCLTVYGSLLYFFALEKYDKLTYSFYAVECYGASLLLLCYSILMVNFKPLSFHWNILASWVSNIVNGDFILGSNLYFWIAILPVAVSCSLLLEHF